MYNHNEIDAISEIAERTLKHISDVELTLTPENFELWFVYFSESDHYLMKALDSLEEAGNINDNHCHNLYKEFFKNSKEEQQVNDAYGRIGSTISKVNNAVAGAREFAVEYNASLEEVNTNLEQINNKEDLDALLQSVLCDTRTMVDQNGYFENLLEESAQAMKALHKELQESRIEAMTDALTGILNRKAFDSQIVEIEQEVRQDDYKTFVLLLLDIDHFKKFNDTFGHQVGDQVLTLVAKTLKNSVKGRDSVFRYGGEEFAIILPETNIQGGMLLGESLLQEIGDKKIINRMTGESIARVTISIGAAEFSKEETFESLILRADNALYAAKENGRNQVVEAKMCSEE